MKLTKKGRETKMKQKVVDWISSHLVEIQGVLVLGVFLVSLISGINSNDTVIMIALLVFVGTEFLVLSVGYLERISNDLKQLTEDEKNKTYDVTVNESLVWTDMAKTAKFDFIICTPTGGSLYNYRRVFDEMPSNVKIRIIIFNLDDNAALDAYCTVVKPRLSALQLKQKNSSFKMLATGLSSRPNVEIRISKTPFDTVYIGRDVFGNTSDAKIKVQHLLRKYGKADNMDIVDDKLIYSIDSDAPHYQVYYRQIKAIWDDGETYLSAKHN